MNREELRQNRIHGTKDFPLAVYIHDKARDTEVKIHWHDETEIIFLENGIFSVSINFQPFEIKAPAFVFVNSGEIHTLFCPVGQGESAVVFDAGMLSFERFDAAQQMVLSPLLTGRLRLPRLITPESSVYREIKSSYDRILVWKEKESAAEWLKIKACLYEVLAALCEDDLLRENGMMGKYTL